MTEYSISEIGRGMAAGTLTARMLVEDYLERIQALDRAGPTLNSVIELNPDALEIAEALDDERSQDGARGPLHGVPVLLKDNIDTGDKMTTTAGSLALEGTIAPQDCHCGGQAAGRPAR